MDFRVCFRKIFIQRLWRTLAALKWRQLSVWHERQSSSPAHSLQQPRPQPPLSLPGQGSWNSKTPAQSVWARSHPVPPGVALALGAILVTWAWQYFSSPGLSEACQSCNVKDIPIEVLEELRPKWYPTPRGFSRFWSKVWWLKASLAAFSLLPRNASLVLWNEHGTGSYQEGVCACWAPTWVGDLGHVPPRVAVRRSRGRHGSVQVGAEAGAGGFAHIQQQRQQEPVSHAVPFPGSTGRDSQGCGEQERRRGVWQMKNLLTISAFTSQTFKWVSFMEHFQFLYHLRDFCISYHSSAH